MTLRYEARVNAPRASSFRNIRDIICKRITSGRIMLSSTIKQQVTVVLRKGDKQNQNDKDKQQIFLPVDVCQESEYEKRLTRERFQSSILKLNEHACHAQHLT